LLFSPILELIGEILAEAWLRLLLFILPKWKLKFVKRLLN